MKLKWILWTTVTLMLAAMGFGIYEKRSYTDISKDASYLEQLYVAELPESNAFAVSRQLSETLPLAPDIVRVTVKGEVEHLFKTSRQLVKVEQIYQGKSLSPGEEFYVTSGRWELIAASDPSDGNRVQSGFINFLNSGEEYLLFLGERVDGPGETTPIFELYGGIETLLAPAFSYQEHKDVIVPIMDGASTYVPYSEVCDNEFFVTTQAALDALLELKETMLQKYPEAVQP